MKRLLLLIPLLHSCLLVAASLPLSHRFYLVSEKRANDQMLLKVFAELNNDSVDEFIYACRTPDYATIMVNDIGLNVHSQLNYPSIIRGIKVLENPLTNERLLFASYNDGARVYLTSILYGWESQLKRSD